MEDSTDAKLFNPLKWISKEKPEKGEGAEPDAEVDGQTIIEKPIKVTEIDIDDECYNMKHAKRGKAIIFNHYKFDNDCKPREGTNKDVINLKNVLKMLQFEVQVYNDLKYGAIHQTLHQLSKENYSDHDCLLITILSHGDPGKVYARDYPYLVEELWDPFAGNKCPTLAGKPKIFLIQACRGEAIDDGVQIRGKSMTETDSRPMKTDTFYKIPSRADYLIMYATFDGYYAWRSCNTGSWFIQCVCKALKTYVLERDLLTILTIANRMIATEFKSCTHDKRLDEKKQIGTIVSTCTRLLYLNHTKEAAQKKELDQEDGDNKMDVDSSQLEEQKSDQKMGEAATDHKGEEDAPIDKKESESEIIEKSNIERRDETKVPTDQQESESNMNEEVFMEKVEEERVPVDKQESEPKMIEKNDLERREQENAPTDKAKSKSKMSKKNANINKKAKTAMQKSDASKPRWKN